MYPVSQDFLNTIRRGGIRKTVIDLYFNQLLTKKNIPVSDWSINSTSGNVIRSNGTCTIVDPLLIPTFFSDASLIIPAGAEIVIRTGFAYAGGAEELVPMGVFTIEAVSWKDGRSSEVQIDFNDRGKVIERYGWNAPKDFSGKLATAVLAELVNFTAPYYSLTTQMSGLSDYRLPGGSVLDNDRLDNIKTVAAGMGGQVYFNRFGNPILTRVPQIDPSTTASAAVWQVDAGTDGVLVEANKGLSRSDVFNGVAVYGAVPDEGKKQPFATVIDNNPNSPTYYGGPFGKVWERIEDSTLTTVTQCQKLASTTLAQRTGLAKSVDFQLVPNAALDVDDIILVKYYNGSTELHIIDSYDISPSGMSARTRSIQYISG